MYAGREEEMTRITTKELNDTAERLGLAIHHECGGFRVVAPCGSGYRNICPEGGICPVTTKRFCITFLQGVAYGERRKAKKKGAE